MSHGKVVLVVHVLIYLHIAIEAKNDQKLQLSSCEAFQDSDCAFFWRHVLSSSLGALKGLEKAMEENLYTNNTDGSWTSTCFGQIIDDSPPLKVELMSRNVQVNEIDEKKQKLHVNKWMDVTISIPRLKKLCGCFETDVFDFPLIWLKKVIGFFPMKYLPSYNVELIGDEDEIKRRKKTGICTLKLSTGSIACTARKNFIISDKMYFHWFPFDVQKLSGYLESEFDENELTISVRQLDNETVGDLVPKWSVRMKMSLDDPRKKAKHGKVGLYSTIKLEFQLSRKLTMHVLQTFIPSGMLCVASAGSVFIPWHLIPGRMGVCITTFLSLISLFNGARHEWIEASSLRAIDAWTILCYIIVFVSLMEYCIILYLTNGEKYDPIVGNSNKISPAMKFGNPAENIRKALFLEKCSRVLFPTYTILSFTLYFMICLLRK